MRSARSIRTAALSVAGGALLAMSVTLAAPASGDPTSPQCFQAEAHVASQSNVVETAANKLSGDTVLLQAAKDKLAQDQAAVPVDTAQIITDQTAVSTLQTTVNNDQASLFTAKRNLATDIAIRDTACAPVVVPTPIPTPIPVPSPVGLPPLTCSDLAARGLSNIPRNSPYYNAALDINNDGIACETNLTTYKVVNHKRCHLVDGSWVPVPATVPPPCPSACSTVTPTQDAPPLPVIIQSPPVTVPGPVIQGQPIYVPGPVVNVPNTSSGVDTGDGTNADVDAVLPKV